MADEPYNCQSVNLNEHGNAKIIENASGACADDSDMLTIAYLSGAHDRQTLIRRIRELEAERDELRRQIEGLTSKDAVEAAAEAWNLSPLWWEGNPDGKKASLLRARAAITAALAVAARVPE